MLQSIKRQCRNHQLTPQQCLLKLESWYVILQHNNHIDSGRNHRRVPTYGYDSQVHDINGSGFAAISPPDGVEIRVRGQNRVFLAWRVHF